MPILHSSVQEKPRNQSEIPRISKEVAGFGESYADKKKVIFTEGREKGKAANTNLVSFYFIREREKCSKKIEIQ